jgi:hypothetical protein
VSGGQLVVRKTNFPQKLAFFMLLTVFSAAMSCNVEL